MITLQQMVACGIAPTQARQFKDALPEALKAFDINTPTRIAAFVAQAAHESKNFTDLEEDLWYTTPERIRQMWPNRVPTLSAAAELLRQPQKLANRVYSNRLGNGDESSGDGWKYRGRGLFQLTGRSNYMAAGAGLGADYKTNPDLVDRKSVV